ncbi:hypothetical protein P5E51_15910, partial [Clostridium perfringens]|nr:hypothetical protein [Clostridium perfringens]
GCGLNNLYGFRSDLDNLDGLRDDGGSNGDGVRLSSSLVDVQDDLHQGSGRGSLSGGRARDDGNRRGNDGQGRGSEDGLSNNTTVGQGEVDDCGSNSDGLEFSFDEGGSDGDGRGNDGQGRGSEDGLSNNTTVGKGE